MNILNRFDLNIVEFFIRFSIFRISMMNTTTITNSKNNNKKQKS